ncbi:MAG: hypothetical protein AAFQ90_09035, partial [Pseudomonadota bacterium]
RVDLETIADNVYGGEDIRPPTWSGAAAVYRCERLVQKFDYLRIALHGASLLIVHVIAMDQSPVPSQRIICPQRMKKQEAGYKFLFKNSRLRRARNSGVAIYIASFSQEFSARS